MHTTSHAPTVAVEPAASLDRYALKCERLRAELRSLGNLNDGQRHTVPVVALFVTSTPPASGRLDIAATWTAPSSDPALGGTLLFAGLMAVRAQAPGVFAELIERLAAERILVPPVAP